MATLHIVNRVGALASCLAVAAPEDSVLLIEDGVYAAAGTTPGPASQHPLLALDVDLAARGLGARLRAGASRISDADFVELVVSHQPIVSWS